MMLTVEEQSNKSTAVELLIDTRIIEDQKYINDVQTM